MLKQNAKYHYGIKKHICGTAYANDFFVGNENMKPLSYIYKDSANFICNELQKKDTHSRYYVVRLD